MTKRERELEKALKDLTTSIVNFEKMLDKIMTISSSCERGCKIAALVNQLSLTNQGKMRHILGYSFNKITKLYEKENSSNDL